METPTLHQDSPGWLFFVHVCFALSLVLTATGIYVLPVNLWIKGYLGMGLCFSIGSTITLCKAVRDQHEHRKLINRLSDAKTEKLLHEYHIKE